MAERTMYRPTEKQLAKWAAADARLSECAMPSDEEFKTRWMKAHHGKVAGWGMGKRDWIVSNMSMTSAYQRGIWQGRVDAARGLEYSEERSENTYNLGYYRGYTEYESNRRGWDAATRARFDAEYVNTEAA